MLIFEILFKNPSILQPNPLFELEAGDGAQERLGRGVFRSAIQVRVNHSVEDFNVKGIVHKKNSYILGYDGMWYSSFWSEGFQ